MTDYTKLVKALRHCATGGCDDCSYLEPCLKKWQKNKNRFGASILMIMDDAAAAIEELQAEVDTLKRTDSKRCQECLYLGQPVGEHLLPHWVSVEERLPNVDEKVLVFAVGKFDGFIGDTVIALTSMSDTNWLNHHEKVDKPYWLDPWQYFLTDYRITHWMPLPQPPQEVQDG